MMKKKELRDSQSRASFSGTFATSVLLASVFLGLSLPPALAACPAISNEADTPALLRLSLDELMQVEISTISKAPENLYDAPGIATIISREEIRRFGGDNLYEILDRAVSVHMTGSILFPRNGTVIRGDQLTGGLDRHVLLLVNGRPIRDALNGGINYPLYTAFPVSAVERIEMTRGPGSALYGTNAYSGVINLITRASPQAGCQAGEFALRGGSFGEFGGEAYVETAGEDYQFSAGLRVSDNEGWRFEGRDVNGVPGGRDWGIRDAGLVMEGRYRDWRFNLAWLESAQDYLGAEMQWGLPNSMRQTRWFGDIGYTWRFSSQRRLQANLGYHLVDGVSGNPDAFASKLRNDQSVLELTHYWQRGALTWLVGGSMEYAQDRFVEYRTPVGLLPDAQPPYAEEVYTLYTQADYQLNPHTQLTIGAQSVKNPGLDWRFIPRLGLIHQFGQGFGGKLLYSEAYRAATQVERNIHFPVILGDPALEPETVHTFDAQLFYQRDRHQASLTYFHSRQQSLIDRRPVASGSLQQVFFNGGELTLQGLELEGKTVPAEQWYWTGSVSYQQNENGLGVEDYTLAPHWQLKLGVSYEFPAGPTLGLFNTYVSQPPDVNARNPNRAFINPEPTAYHLTTFNLEWPLGKLAGLSEARNLVLNAYVYNLLDEDIHAPEINAHNINSVPAKSGRAWYAGMKLRF